MTPSARTQAASELLDAIVAAARDSGAAADTLIARYFSTRRYAGSKDRRAVRELVYEAIRHTGARPESGRAAMLALANADAELAATFDGSAHGPAPIVADEPVAPGGAAPTWLVNRLNSAGSKPLAPAASMCNVGKILASDTDRARLSRLAPRAERAGVSIVETRLLDPGHEALALADWAGSADVVLIAAPCSGTGTWRRNPEARWRQSPARLDKLVLTQRQLLGIGAKLVKPDGALVFIVCSLLDEEGAGQVAAFLASHLDWSADTLALPAGRPHGPGMRLTPAHDATDGFFVARLKRAC